MGKAQVFDGFGVEAFEGKFKGGFDLDQEVADEINHGDEVVFLVRTTVKGASFDDDKDGRIKRKNSFQIVDALVVEDLALVAEVERSVIYGARQSVDGQVKGQLNIDMVDLPVSDVDDEWEPAKPSPLSPPPPSVDGGPAIPPSSDPVLREFLGGV